MMTPPARKIAVLVYRPGEPASELVELEDSLTVLQGLVDGYIESVSFERLPGGGRLAIICNEDGHRLGLPLNRARIRGTFFAVRCDAAGEFESLTAADVRLLRTVLGP